MSEKQLDWFSGPAERPAAWLEDLLRSRPGWMTAAQILQFIGEPASQDRKIRMLAQASNWIISGQKGYKHLEHATAEEVNHFANWMESQARKMSERACALRRHAHQRIGT